MTTTTPAQAPEKLNQPKGKCDHCSGDAYYVWRSGRRVVARACCWCKEKVGA